MTKKKVTILMLLMALALAGIIAIQLFWMRKAFIVRNELFDRSVNEALIRSSERLETFNDVNTVQNIFTPMPPPAPPINPVNPVRPMHFQHNGGINHFRNYSYNRDTIINELINENGHQIQKQVKIVSGKDHANLTQQVTVEFTDNDSLLQKFKNKIDHNISMMYGNTFKNRIPDSMQHSFPNGWERRVGHKAERLKNLAGQMMYETWIWNSESLPDTSLLKDILTEELKKRDVPIGYQFAIMHGDSLLMKSSGYDISNNANPTYSARLFPNAIFNQDNQITIRFPQRNAFLLKTLIMPASLSLLFCLIIMGTFGLSIFYIIRQKKVSEMKSDFINNMTHEFKTPLATIAVATDSIVNPRVISNPEMITNYASIIRKENQRMNQQVETILRIASLDRKDFDFQFHLTDIHQLIEKAVQGIILQVENRNGYIDVEENAVNPMVTTDQGHTLNLLNNLLDNANKYSPDIPEITISTRNSDRGVWIAVTDHGIGMSKQVQSKIFEKFYREQTGNIHNVKGFGLGLSYVKAVVDANHGEIKVTSEPGKGSTFEVFIPFTINL